LKLTAGTVAFTSGFVAHPAGRRSHLLEGAHGQHVVVLLVTVPWTVSDGVGDTLAGSTDRTLEEMEDIKF